VCVSDSTDSINITDVKSEDTKALLQTTGVCINPFLNPANCMNLAPNDLIAPGWPLDKWSQDKCGCVAE